MIPSAILLISLAVLSVGVFQSGNASTLSAAWIAFSGVLFATGVFLLDRDEYPEPPPVTLMVVLLLLFGFTTLLQMRQLPVWSDDWYRYYWDALIQADGLNPFVHLPKDIQERFPDFRLIYEEMNSPGYYSVYPPVAQYIFRLSNLWDSLNFDPSGFLLRLRAILSFLTVWTAWFLYAGVENRPSVAWLLLGLLMPLALIHGLQDLHVDWIAATFVIFSLAGVRKQALLTAGVFFALAVWTKLNPLIIGLFLFPVFLKGFKSGLVRFGLAFFITSLLVWIPYLDVDGFAGIFSSIRLYVQTFEFNSFIYGAGILFFDAAEWWWLKSVWGPFLWLVAALWIGYQAFLSFRIEDFGDRLYIFLMAMAGYWLLNSTIHPWYLLMPVLVMIYIRKLSFGWLTWSVWVSFTMMMDIDLYTPQSFWLLRILEYGTVIPLFVFDYYTHVVPHIRKREPDNQQQEISFS